LGQPRKEEGFNKEWQTNKRRWELGSLTIEKKLKDCVGRSMEEWRGREEGVGARKRNAVKMDYGSLYGNERRREEEEDG
jgi:hypothetical protein